jgi:cell division protein FtsW (lipid II flippase)
MLLKTANRPLLTSDQIQSRLLLIGGTFLFIYSIVLSLSPAGRARSWDVEFRLSHWFGFGVWAIGIYLFHTQSRRRLPGRDPILFPIVALLSGWGLLTIWRLTPTFGIRQTIWLGLALAGSALGTRLPLHLNFLRRYKYLWLTSGLILTALTLFFGTNPSGFGSRQWLGCCGIYLQPSEPLKLLLIAYLAAYLADNHSRPISSGSRESLLPLLAPTFIMTGIALLLLLVQRDLGTATIFLFIYAAVVYIGSEKKRIIFATIASLAVVGIAGYRIFDVVRLRVDSWLNPWLDPTNRSYQIVQSLIAIASGEVIGRGPGMGNPALVPLTHSDFIFTAITEETGLLGALGLIGLLALLLHRGLRIALNAPDRYRSYLAAGLTTYLAVQSVLIIGGNLRLLPLTGVTLPFISYGGSSLLTTFLSILFLTIISSSERRSPSNGSLNPNPALILAGIVLVGFGAAALFSGWWTIIRGQNLISRLDNPRLAIADRFVYRGNLLDRNGRALTSNQGTTGNLVRQYPFPPLGAVLGYTDLTFGQSGLEAGLDQFLRGIEGNTNTVIWQNQIIYGQHPPGLDVRLSLDIDYQLFADNFLGENSGAIVLLNAQSGEILIMASHPTFDANLLDDSWDDLRNDPTSPLLNRATQGSYPVGSVLGPLLLAATLEGEILPSLPGNLQTPAGGGVLACATDTISNTWETAIRSGCPGPVAILGENLGRDQLRAIFQNSGLYTPPEIRIPTLAKPAPEIIQDPGLAALGLDGYTISPLQLAVAGSVLSADGIRPNPRLAIAFRTPDEDWSPLPAIGSAQVRVFPQGIARQAATMLASDSLAIWESIAIAGQTSPVTWFLGGTLPDWEGIPVVVAVLLEEKNPDLAAEIGEELLSLIIQGG